MNKQDKSLEEEEDFNLEEKDPKFFQAMKEYYVETRKEPSAKSRNMAVELAEVYKEKLTNKK